MTLARSPGRITCVLAAIGAVLALCAAIVRLSLLSDLAFGLAFAAAVLAVVALTAWRSSRHPPGVAGPWRFLVLTLLLFAGSRLWWALVSPTLPFSDFLFYDLVARELAAGGPITARWPHLGFIAAWGYPVVLGGAYALFGSALVVAKLLNVALGIVALLALYALTVRIAGAPAARVACVLLLLSPRQLLYSGVVATENLALPLLLSALAIAAWLVSDGRTAVRWVASAVLGVLLGAAFVTRSVAAVASIAVLVALGADRADRRRGFWRCVVVAAAIVATVLSYRVALRHGAGVAPESGVWWSLYVGANVEHLGKWNPEDSARFVGHPDLASANRSMRDGIVERLAADPTAQLQLAPRKVAVLWDDGTEGTYWAFHEMEAGPFADRLRAQTPLWLVAAQAFHVVLLALAALGLAIAATRPASRAIAMIVLFLWLGSLAHAVLETQARYGYTLAVLLMPFGGIAIAATRRSAAEPRPDAARDARAA